MKKLMLLMATVVPLSAVVVAMPTSAASRPAQAAAVSRCSAVHVAAPAGAAVESVSVTAQPGGTVTFPASPLSPEPVTISGLPAWCDITVTVTHPGVHDHVAIKTWLPQQRSAWNGRFQATGGSAYQAGIFGAPLAAALKDGYAAAATDAGVGQSSIDVSAWALKPSGTVDKGLLKNFSTRSLHDMAVISKQVINAFYGKPAQYSYWNGCSTGGRQGYLEAQQYPRDFQGILADAPAVNWDRFAVATLWPQVVFNEEHVQPTQCELEAFNTAAVNACDTIDGVRDGIIDNPQECRWDPRRLIGTKVECEGKTLTITATLADVVRKIWAGPVAPDGSKLWYGPNKGASFLYLAKAGTPFVVADQWVKYFVERDPKFDVTTLTYRKFAQLFRDSERKYNDVIGTDDPNLSAFAATGGKLLSWHGQADQLVPTQGTVDYRKHVNEVMGGNRNVDRFYRLFLLPGVAHCGGGIGLQPTDAFSQLVAWVEHGRAPATLATSLVSTDGTTITRDVCKYPEITQYDGTGDPHVAASYHCTG